jgi:hypothetical protein
LLDEIKASQIQEVKVPATFEELLQTPLFYSGITNILFGPQSALVYGVTTIVSTIPIKKIIFKARIAANAEFPTKVLHATEIRIQCWLGECLQFDWSTTVLLVLMKSLRWS